MQRAAWAHRPMRSTLLALEGCFPPYLVLLRVGLPCPRLYSRAVRSYRTFSPLPRRWNDRNDRPDRPGYCGSRVALHRVRETGAEEGSRAVSFLWHWPSAGLEADIPDVIRHTALRSSDFPPRQILALAKKAGSDRPVLLPVLSLPQLPS